ncbi:fibronectin type III domain containing protein 3C1-like [Alexandromys fortis]|uniref:fibronectin type III domain containing protein 3C1-like n=1 Tax=Alexandromys fortis TaxID=100897 RepID=UPI0021526A69|nr:fibronectin type III domain containing protein 3C1-like [Microtus fortis]
MSYSRMLSEDKNTWEEKEGEWKQERGEKTEHEQSALEELFPSGRSHPQISVENNPENNTKYRAQPCCSNLEKPVISNIQTRSATVSWNLNSTEKCDHINSPVTCELALSSYGKNEVYKSMYNGNEGTVALHDLQPCTVYFLR